MGLVGQWAAQTLSIGLSMGSGRPLSVGASPWEICDHRGRIRNRRGSFLKHLHSKRILDSNLLGDSHIAGGETEVAYLRFLRE